MSGAIRSLDTNHPFPIHSSLCVGCNVILSFLESLRAAGVDHVALNFQFGERDAVQEVDEIGREIAASRVSAVSQTAAI
jgi:hypothetical protein